MKQVKMLDQKPKIPIVTEEIVDLLTKKPLIGKELYCTREEMLKDNPFLIDLVSCYIYTLPKEDRGSAVSAAVFTYHVLKKQEEYDSGIQAQTNSQVH